MTYTFNEQFDRNENVDYIARNLADLYVEFGTNIFTNGNKYFFGLSDNLIKTLLKDDLVE